LGKSKKMITLFKTVIEESRNRLDYLWWKHGSDIGWILAIFIIGNLIIN